MSSSPNARSRLDDSAPQVVVAHNVQYPVHIGFVVSMLAFMTLYARGYISLVTFWAKSDLYQYALLIFPVTAVLVWSRRDWLARVAAWPRPAGLWGVAALGGLWLLGAAAEINVAMQIVLILIWPAMVYVFYGRRVFGILAFALGYLLFAIPFRNVAMEYLVVPLQTVTANLAVFALHFTDLPVLLDGHYILTPVTTWHVAKACSGISFFVATSAFSVLYAHLFYNSWRRRLIFVGFALMVPIIANALRVFFTILIGEYFGLQYATGTDHLIFGWQFFGAVIVLLFLCGMPWHEPPAKPPALKDEGSHDAAGKMRLIIPLTLVLIALPAAWFTGTGIITANADFQPQVRLPKQLAGLTMIAPAQQGPAGLSIQGMDMHESGLYGDARRPVRVDYFGTHVGSDSRDIVNLSDELYGFDRWQVSRGPMTLHAQTGDIEFTVLELAARNGPDRRTLLYAYRMGSVWTNSPLRFKAWKILSRLMGRPAPIGIVVASSAGSANSSKLSDVAAAAAHQLSQSE